MEAMLCILVSTIHWPNAGLMLARSFRRRPNINPALGECIVFTGMNTGPTVQMLTQRSNQARTIVITICWSTLDENDQEGSGQNGVRIVTSSVTWPGRSPPRGDRHAQRDPVLTSGHKQRLLPGKQPGFVTAADFPSLLHHIQLPVRGGDPANTHAHQVNLRFSGAGGPHHFAVIEKCGRGRVRSDRLLSCSCPE